MLRYILPLLFTLTTGCPEDSPAPNPAPTEEPAPKDPKPVPIPAPAPSEEPPPPKPGRMVECYDASPSICAIEKHLFELTNEIRKKHGKGPMGISYEGAYAARNWSAQQAAAGKISHTGFPSARNAFLSKELNGLTLPFRGENVAMFTGGHADEFEIAAKFAKMWENSSGHLKNMISDSKYLGNGVFLLDRGEGFAAYATQLMHN